MSAKRPVPSAKLDAIFGALAHPARRQILVSLIARGGMMTAGEIADRFKHAWPTTTRHLGVLEEVGALRVVKRGRQRHYLIESRVLEAARAWMEQLVAGAAEVEDSDDRPEWTRLPYASMSNTKRAGS